MFITTLPVSTTTRRAVDFAVGFIEIAMQLAALLLRQLRTVRATRRLKLLRSRPCITRGASLRRAICPPVARPRLLHTVAPALGKGELRPQHDRCREYRYPKLGLAHFAYLGYPMLRDVNRDSRSLATQNASDLAPLTHGRVNV